MPDNTTSEQSDLQILEILEQLRTNGLHASRPDLSQIFLKTLAHFEKTFSLKYSSLVRKRKVELFRSFQLKKCFIAIQIFLQSVDTSLYTFRSFFVGDITLCS